MHHPDLKGKAVCYLCNLDQGPNGVATITPTDLYHRRVYLEPLALYLTLDAGTFASLSLDLVGKSANITFAPMGNVTFPARRLRVNKLSPARPGSAFQIGALNQIRGAFEVPAKQQIAVLTWQ